MFGVSTSLNSIIYLLNSKQAEVFLKNDALLDIAYTVYEYQKKEERKTCVWLKGKLMRCQYVLTVNGVEKSENISWSANSFQNGITITSTFLSKWWICNIITIKSHPLWRPGTLSAFDFRRRKTSTAYFIKPTQLPLFQFQTKERGKLILMPFISERHCVFHS